jgi:hypothetical protein
MGGKNESSGGSRRESTAAGPPPDCATGKFMSDLDEPATVFWTPETHTRMLGIAKERFSALRDALKFVMEDSDPHKRSRVQIVTSEGIFLALADIEKRYNARSEQSDGRSLRFWKLGKRCLWTE